MGVPACPGPRVPDAKQLRRDCTQKVTQVTETLIEGFFDPVDVSLTSRPREENTRFGPGFLSMSPARYNNSMRQFSGRDPIGKACPGGALNHLGVMKIGSAQGQSEAPSFCFCHLDPFGTLPRVSVRI